MSPKKQKAEANESAIKPLADELVQSETPNLRDPHKPKDLNLRFGLIVGFATLVVIAVIWSVLSLSLLKFNLGSVSIAADVSNSTLINDLETQSSSYRLAIKYPDNTTKYYPLSSLGLSLNNSKTLANFNKERHSLVNQITFWKPLKPRLAFNVNWSSMTNFVSASTEIIVQPPTDAKIDLSGSNIVISGAITGKQYGLNNSSGTLIGTAAELSSSPIKLQTLAVNPALTTAELMPYKEELTKVLSQPANFEVGGQTVTASPSDIASWLEITPDDKSKKLDISVNSGKVLAYLDSLAGSFIRPVKDQIVATNSDGSQQVLVPGENGITIAGENSIATQVANSLLGAKGISETLAANYQPYQTITAGNYPKWIEVDTTTKRLYAYENTTLVMTDLVSAGAPATPTVTGQYAIYSKYVSQDMQGENVDGSSYFQPNVPWVNYFYKDYAIHGNYWRPLSYFGNVNSSHGCVGLMVNDAAWIYNWAPIGTPVIIHT